LDSASCNTDILRAGVAAPRMSRVEDAKPVHHLSSGPGARRSPLVSPRPAGRGEKVGEQLDDTLSLVVMDPVRGIGQASGQINGADSILIELVEADETPAVVIVTWPVKPTVLHPRRFPQPLTLRHAPPSQPLRDAWAAIKRGCKTRCSAALAQRVADLPGSRNHCASFAAIESLFFPWAGWA
jgi:hypothetical protein